MDLEANPERMNGEPAAVRVAEGSLATVRERPVLKEIVVEASKALARLDSNRLEELARSCAALNRDLAPLDAETRLSLAGQARDAAVEMAIFARVMEATRANLNVMERLRDLRAGRLEYGELPLQEWVRTENGHGNN
jgi:hypothetical protein